MTEPFRDTGKMVCEIKKVVNSLPTKYDELHSGGSLSADTGQDDLARVHGSSEKESCLN